MTIVVATLGGIWSDRKVTDSSGLNCHGLRKVFRKDNLSFGLAGSIQAIVNAPKCIGRLNHPDDFVELVGDHSVAVVVYDGSIWEVIDGYSLRMPGEVHAIGSGSDCARGFLAGRRAHTEKAIKAAIGFCSILREDCGGGIDFVKCP